MILAIYLGIGSWFDIRKRRIPVWVFPAMGIMSFAVNMMLNYSTDYLIGAAIGLSAMFIIMLILAVFCGGGGADILLMSAIGLAVTIKYALEIIIIAYIPFAAVSYVIRYREIKKGIPKEKRTKELPFVPFVAFGFVADVIYNLIANLL